MHLMLLPQLARQSLEARFGHPLLQRVRSGSGQARSKSLAPSASGTGVAMTEVASTAMTDKKNEAFIVSF